MPVAITHLFDLGIDIQDLGIEAGSFTQSKRCISSHEYTSVFTSQPPLKQPSLLSLTF